jgi:hypothetical protein
MDPKTLTTQAEQTAADATTEKPRVKKPTRPLSLKTGLRAGTYDWSA